MRKKQAQQNEQILPKRWFVNYARNSSSIEGKKIQKYNSFNNINYTRLHYTPTYTSTKLREQFVSATRQANDI
jgi:hypothetical protein